MQVKGKAPPAAGQNLAVNPSKARPLEPTGAKKRWDALFGKVVADFHSKDEDRHQHQGIGLIEELKRAKHGRSRIKGGVLSLLKSQASLTEKVFERQKYSAKEIFIRKKGKIRDLSLDDSFSIAEYDRQARMRYSITPEIQTKLVKIKDANEEADAKRRKSLEGKKKLGFFETMIHSTIIGQVLKANPRFYKMDPLEHLPPLCRRCRRPLSETLESRFTSMGILFCILFPILGIILLFANQEFVCVVCQEIYVYGDLTARPEEQDSSEDEEERK